MTLSPGRGPWGAATIRWVMLDLDGCLVDSTAAITGCINAALNTLGLPSRPPAELTRFIGPPLTEAFATLLAEAGAPQSWWSEAIAAYRQRYAEVSLTETVMVDGIVDELERLAERCELRVVTTKPRPYAAPIVRNLGLDRWIGEVHGPEPDDLDEPKSVTLARALRAAGAADQARAATVMVGDRHHDIEAGRHLGTHTLGVTWGAGDHSELVGAGADHVIGDVTSLAASILDGTA